MSLSPAQPHRLQRAWAAGRPATMGWIMFDAGLSVEVMARVGFDALCVDLQHGAVNAATLLPVLQAINQTDTAAVVRVPANDAAQIMRALDLGADALIVPMIDTARDAAAAVAAARYPPAGVRSYGPARPFMPARQGRSPAELDAQAMVMAMIETREGLANLEAICATPGLAAIYVGPADLSLALGLPPRSDNPEPAHLAACDRIVEAAHRHGLKACMHCASASFAAAAVARGFDLAMLTSDMGAMTAGVKRQLEDFAALTAT